MIWEYGKFSLKLWCLALNRVTNNQVNRMALKVQLWRHSGLMVSVLESRLKEFVLCPRARNFTLTVLFSIQLYRYW